MTKIADSAAIRANIATPPRSRSSHASESFIVVRIAAMGHFSHYSYFQSGSSGCFRSQRGRRLRTVGIAAKLYAGGGELVDHSRVHASQGSLPASLPLK